MQKDVFQGQLIELDHASFNNALLIPSLPDWAYRRHQHKMDGLTREVFWHAAREGSGFYFLESGRPRSHVPEGQFGVTLWWVRESCFDDPTRFFMLMWDEAIGTRDFLTSPACDAFARAVLADPNDRAVWPRQ